MRWVSPRSLLTTAALLASSVISLAENPEQQAWRMLQMGATAKSAEERVVAVGALGLVLRNPGAAALAEKALKDDKPVPVLVPFTVTFRFY